MPQVHFAKKAGKYGIVLSYTVDEIQSLSREGHFLEAFGRLDKMIDQVLFGLMHKHFHHANDLVSALVDEDFSGLSAAKALHKTGKIPKGLYDSLRAFKTSRNVVAHDIYGHYAFALRQAGEVKDEADLKRKADAKAQSFLREGLGAFSDLMNELHAKTDVFGHKRSVD